MRALNRIRPMGTPREERLAANEAMFRTANERRSEWEEHHANEAEELYFCECADDDCREKVSLRKADYENVRSNSRHFLIVLGHEIPDIETVIEKHGGWAVIEKDPEVTETVESLDPRRP
jgi:hypothetical protein